MPRTKTTVTEAVGEYLARHARQDDILARVEQETAARPDAMMQITPDEGALLTLLVKLTNAQRALEVGTFTGYSAICIARGLANGGRLTCLELDPEFAAIAQRNLEDAGVADRVEIRVGPAGESLAEMPEEPTFDFVFLDADKHSYPEYLTWALQLSRNGTLIVADNVVRDGAVIDARSDDANVQGVRRFGEMVAADPRLSATVIQTVGSKGYDGLTFAVVTEDVPSAGGPTR